MRVVFDYANSCDLSIVGDNRNTNSALCGIQKA